MRKEGKGRAQEGISRNRQPSDLSLRADVLEASLPISITVSLADFLFPCTHASLISLSPSTDEVADLCKRQIHEEQP